MNALDLEDVTRYTAPETAVRVTIAEFTEAIAVASKKACPTWTEHVLTMDDVKSVVMRLDDWWKITN